MIVLVGVRDTKRTEYFMKAARELDVEVQFVEWDTVYRNFTLENPFCHYADFQRAVIKFEPPSYQTAEFSEMQKQLQTYRHALEGMTGDFHFVNSPQGILDALDKRKMKGILETAGVSVTPGFMEHVDSAEQLYACMDAENVSAVFLKPVCFSGAAGVVALRRQRKSGKMAAYTSCTLETGGMINTKKIHMMREETSISELINALVPMDIMAEKWIPKDTVNGNGYDLRVVWQFGKRKHIVVRQSASPITNLHLNNRAADAEIIGMEKRTYEEIDALCECAMEAVPELHVAGIDILLEKGSRKPRIIEINGQGDLIYQDIFGKNKIYKEQIRWMLGQLNGANLNSPPSGEDFKTVIL